MSQCVLFELMDLLDLCLLETDAQQHDCDYIATGQYSQLVVELCRAQFAWSNKTMNHYKLGGLSYSTALHTFESHLLTKIIRVRCRVLEEVFAIPPQTALYGARVSDLIFLWGRVGSQ